MSIPLHRGGSATASPRPSPKSVRFTSVEQIEQASPQGGGLEQTGIPYQSALSTALLAQQLPPIGKFSSESSLADRETFEAWREQFEMVASVSHWDPQTKLVNLMHYSIEGSSLHVLSVMYSTTAV